MDAGLSAAWATTIAIAVVAAVGAGMFVALGAYKIGKLSGKLKKAGDVVPSSVPAPSAAKEEDVATSDPTKKEKEKEKKKDSSGDEDSESSADEEESGNEAEAKAEKKSKKSKSSKSKTREVKKKVKDDDWEWPIYDTWWSDVTYRMVRKLRAKEKGKHSSAPFEVSYEQRKGWPDEVSVTLSSKSLIRVTKECLPKQSEHLLIEKPLINGKNMFVALNAFQEAYKSIADDEQALGRHHLKHLVRFLEKEYKDTIVHFDRAKRERKVSWGLLWAFLHKGEKVYYKCALTGETLQGIVKYCHYFSSHQGRHLRVAFRSSNWNGVKYVKCRGSVTIDEFQSEKSFEAIGMCPMSILEGAEVARLEAMFLRNGRKFYDIVRRGSSYLQYQGPRLRMVLNGACWQLKKQKADGRVMADLLSFARMNPDYPLENAGPPTCCGPRSLSCEETEAPSDEELMLAPAVVYGFSFANKQWGGFDVNGFSGIEFDDQAFDRDLVLSDPSRKQMLLSLVSEHLRDPASSEEGENLVKLDPISNKGEGCIFLCYGPPGTGKTLTAESIAERLHRPLWSISVFELGTTAKDLESNLMEILDIASQWRAVLLLDEADIYMEKRTSVGDPNRTAMTAIFLRLLEYYCGVLFLTTNRVATFDDAFCSRISMFLRYHRLAGAQCEAVWSNLFARAGVEDPDLAPFLESQLNGREIRNTIRIAQTWAKSSGEHLTASHVLQVVNMLGEFRHDLVGAIQDETDERSITRALAKVRSMKDSGGSDTALNGHFVNVAAASTTEDA